MRLKQAIEIVNKMENWMFGKIDNPKDINYSLKEMLEANAKIRKANNKATTFCEVTIAGIFVAINCTPSYLSMARANGKEVLVQKKYY